MCCARISDAPWWTPLHALRNHVAFVSHLEYHTLVSHSILLPPFCECFQYCYILDRLLGWAIWFIEFNPKSLPVAQY